jgi:hypothetical protein
MSRVAEELRGRLAERQEEIEALLDRDVAALNRAAAELDVPYVMVPKAAEHE